MKIKFEVDKDGDIYFSCPNCLRRGPDWSKRAHIKDGKIVYDTGLKEEQIICCYQCGNRYLLTSYDEDSTMCKWKDLDENAKEDEDEQSNTNG